jgi:hypothetical protein
MTNAAKLRATLLALSLLAFFIAASASQDQPQNSQMQPESKGKESKVYVCACLKTKSCSCMTEAKTGGPCACGTHGGPPMKAVPKDSDWAKENREALAK